MDRIRTQLDSEPIGAALELLPARIAERLAHVRFLAGSDPVAAGLHRHEFTLGGLSYRETAHAVYPVHLAHRPRVERVTTVVLPKRVEPRVVVHELGHALHEAVGFDCHVPNAVTAYAQTNDYEAFAEAFAAWVCPVEYQVAQPDLLRDHRTLALFDELARV